MNNTNNTIKSLNIQFTDTFLHDKWHLKDITIDEEGFVVLHTISVNKPYPIVTNYNANSFYNIILNHVLFVGHCKIVTCNKSYDIILDYKDLPFLVEYFDTNLPMYLI